MLKEKTIKVLLLPAWYPSEEQPVTGVFIKEHAKAVALYDDVVVLYVTMANSQMRGCFTLTDEIDEGIRTIIVKYRKSPIPYTNLLLSIIINTIAILIVVRRLVKEGFRPDIIHVHVYLAGVPAVILGILYKVPVIITEHHGNFINHTFNKLEIFMARYVMKRAMLVLPVSNCLKKHLQEYYGIHANFNIIPNVVNTKLFCNKEPGKIKHPTPKKLLTVALLDPIKGISYLLQGVKRLRFKRQDFILDIVGDGPSRRELEALSIKEGINDIVKFHGIKNKKEISQFMREANIFVLPSISENLPCVLIEAISSGLPIIATNVGGIPEMISNDIGQLVSPKNADELADAIDYMLDHYQNYDPKSIRRYALEKYDYATVGLQIDKLYRQSIVNYKMGKR